MLIEVLLLHRQLPADALVKAMTICLRIGSVSTDLVAIEARKAMEGTDAEDAELLGDHHDSRPQADGTPGPEGEGAKVISLHAGRLPLDMRPSLPDMSKYDRLLTPVATPDSTTRKGHGA
ncbi:hypothetical protein ACFWOJ_31910 [Streptomyces sp. NPDC058439]|uniref:hypothetical protein n=1 Tax=Streptomyces sp. NPDC058439 TaxID=3346500 RepID=UPI00364B660B